MNIDLDRRSFLRGLAALPLLPSMPLRPGRRKARSMIVVFLDGGMSHLDTFDGKPEASVAIRGDMKLVRADVEGVFISAHLPKLQKRMSRCTLVRSLTHGEGNHDRGTHFLLTGHRPSPALVHPALGACLSLDADPAAALPPYVVIPDMPDYGGAGFLPRALSPFATGGEPEKGGFAVPDLAPREGRARVDQFIDALDSLDGAPRSADETVRDRLRQRARAISADASLRELFALDREKPAERERFGRHRLGQACLLALRLCQGGVGTVLVRDTVWDHHNNIHRALTYGFPPKLTQLDDSLSGLIDALADRGLQDDVTVCLVSEFGRTPRLNPQAGRDHWPRAQCALLFGAGIKQGAVIGSTDAHGEEPATDPVGPSDVCATLLHARGADLDRILRTEDGRPVRLVPEGARPIAAALA